MVISSSRWSILCGSSRWIRIFDAVGFSWSLNKYCFPANRSILSNSKKKNGSVLFHCTRYETRWILWILKKHDFYIRIIFLIMALSWMQKKKNEKIIVSAFFRIHPSYPWFLLANGHHSVHKYNLFAERIFSLSFLIHFRLYMFSSLFAHCLCFCGDTELHIFQNL